MIKSVGKSEHGCCDHKTSRNTTCCAEMRKIFVLGRVGAGYQHMGRVKIRKKKEKWGRRVSAEWPCIHFCQRSYRRFYSVGEYVGETCYSNPSVIPSIFLTVNRSHHAYGSPVFIPSEKSPAKTSAPPTCPFFIHTEFSVGNSVGNYRRIQSVGNYRLNYQRKYFVGDFDRKIPTEKIPSVSPLVFSKFLVVTYLFICFFNFRNKVLNDVSFCSVYKQLRFANCS